MIEDESIAEGWLEWSTRRVRESLRHFPPRRLAWTEPGVEVAAKNDRPTRRKRSQQRIGLTGARGVAEERAKQTRAILEMRVDHEQAISRDLDCRGNGAAALALSWQIDHRRHEQRLRRDDRVAADAVRGATHLAEERREIARVPDCDDIVLAALDRFLQQQNVIANCDASRPPAFQVVE
jgi:hypothetical protein